MMPLNDLKLWGSRRGAHYSICEAIVAVHGQVLGTGLVHGPGGHNGWSDAASRASQRPPAGTACGTRPPCLVNGYENHGYQGRGGKVPPAKPKTRQPSLGSALTDAPAAGKVGSPHGVSGRWASKQGADAPACHQYQKPPDQNSPAARKNRRRRGKKSNHTKRETPPPLQEEEEEDWESELQDVTTSNWAEVHFGSSSYGPEDLLDFPMRNVTLGDWDTGVVLVRKAYKPFVHHPQPIKWFHYGRSTETEQFEDAEE